MGQLTIALTKEIEELREEAKKQKEWTRELQDFITEVFDLLTVRRSNRTYESPSQACRIVKNEIIKLLKKNSDEEIDYDGVLLGRRGDIKDLLNKVVQKKALEGKNG